MKKPCSLLMEEDLIDNLLLALQSFLKDCSHIGFFLVFCIDAGIKRFINIFFHVEFKNPWAGSICIQRLFLVGQVVLQHYLSLCLQVVLNVSNREILSLGNKVMWCCTLQSGHLLTDILVPVAIVNQRRLMFLSLNQYSKLRTCPTVSKLVPYSPSAHLKAPAILR